MTLIVLFFSYFVVNGQVVVQDRANRAQLGRMVYKHWDVWEPTPDWKKILGVPVYPKNVGGYLFWGILHNNYRKSDKRPYRDGVGPGDIYETHLLSERATERHVRDSLEVMMKGELSTYASKAGGAMDVPYMTYFKDVFQELFEEVPNLLLKVNQRDPRIYSAFVETDFYKGYSEFTEVTMSDIKAINDSYSDRGKKINAYLEVKRKFERQNKRAKDILGRMTIAFNDKKLNVDGIVLPDRKTYENDKELAQEILRRFRF